MRVFFEQNTIKQSLSDVQCNVCGRSVSKDATGGYFEDHVSISKTWGYHSPYDGEIHAMDVCVDCYQGWTEQFAIPPRVTEYICFDHGLCACSC